MHETADQIPNSALVLTCPILSHSLNLFPQSPQCMDSCYAGREGGEGERKGGGEGGERKGGGEGGEREGGGEEGRERGRERGEGGRKSISAP